MPQKVKIQTGFSEKTTENYQSQQYSVALEMEVSINGSTSEISEASNKLFALCRRLVSQQKAVNVDNLLTAAPVEQHPPVSTPVAPAIAAPSAATPVSNAGNGTKAATSKQIKYALELAKKSGMSKSDIAALPAKFNKASFEALSAKEASSIIEGFAKKAA
jgi:hypothetical protein